MVTIVSLVVYSVLLFLFFNSDRSFLIDVDKPQGNSSLVQQSSRSGTVPMPMTFVSARKIAMGIVCLVFVRFWVQHLSSSLSKSDWVFLSFEKTLHCSSHQSEIISTKGESVTLGQGPEVLTATEMSLTLLQPCVWEQ